MAADGRSWLRLGITLAVAGLLVWSLRSRSPEKSGPLAESSLPSPAPAAETSLEPGAREATRSPLVAEESRAATTTGSRAGLKGRVLGEDGAPIVGAAVRIEFRSPAGRALPLGAVLSDARGEWARPECPDGILIEIEVLASGFARTRVQPRRALRPGDTESFDLVLGPALVFTGRVVDGRTNRPIHAAVVTIINPRASAPNFEQGLTDAEGRFRLAESTVSIAHADARRLRVRADFPGFTPFAEERPAGDGVFDIRLWPADASLELRLEARSEDSAAWPARVLVVSEGLGSSFHTVEAGETLHLEGLCAGRVQLVAEAPALPGSRPLFAARLVELQPGANTATIDLEPSLGGSLAGIVRDEYGAPIGGVALILEQSFEAWEASTSFGGDWLETDEHGEFSRTALSPMHYRLTCRGGDGERLLASPSEYGFELHPGERRERLEFRLVPGISFEGRVAVPFPERSLTLELLDSEGRKLLASATLGADQTFRFGPLSPARYRLRLFEHDDLAAELELGPESRSGIELLSPR
jgi:hypothetical protein